MWSSSVSRPPIVLPLEEDEQGSSAWASGDHAPRQIGTYGRRSQRICCETSRSNSERGVTAVPLALRVSPTAARPVCLRARLSVCSARVSGSRATPTSSVTTRPALMRAAPFVGCCRVLRDVFSCGHQTDGGQTGGAQDVEDRNSLRRTCSLSRPFSPRIHTAHRDPDLMSNCC
jgi:hypothetical protein